MMRGQTLIDVVLALGIGGLVSLAIAALFSYGVEQFNLLRDQNLAQDSLLQSAFYTRFYLGQAVKTRCCSDVASCNTAGGAIATGYTIATPAPDFEPTNVALGVVDCRIGGAWVAGRPNALALFVREGGSGSAPVSTFVPSGIYFEPPTGTQSGILYFVSATAGSFVVDQSALFFDRLVNVDVLSVNRATVAPGNGALQSIDIKLTTRYFKKIGGGAVSYAPAPPATTPLFRDIESVVTVTLKDNIIGIVQDGSGITTNERPHGGLYYYNPIIPPLSTMKF